MKKGLIILAAIAGLILCSSCSKTCDCKAKANGEVVFETTYELKGDERCSDYNAKIEALGHSVESKCTPKLF